MKNIETVVAELAAARIDTEGDASDPVGVGNLGVAGSMAVALFFSAEVPSGQPRVSRAALHRLSHVAMRSQP